jgi:hypothetical protein
VPTEHKADKGARNQSLFREVNERIEELTANDAVPTEELWNFLCECSSTECVATVSLRYQEYEEIRRVPTHFPIKPGHHDPDIERVVEETERYAVVEKFGEAGKRAIELDPRRNGTAA